MNKSEKISIEKLFKRNSFPNPDQDTMEKMKPITSCDGVHGGVPEFVLERMEKKFTDEEIEEAKKRLAEIRKSQEKKATE